MKNSQKRFFSSVLIFVLCISMLIGTTFAWFTDSVSSGGNIIETGNLDLEMYWTDDLNSGKWYNVEDEEHNTIFNYDNWEPGYTEIRYIKLKNSGNLALNYQLSITPQGSVGKLAEVINVYYSNDGVAISERENLDKLNAIGLLSNVMNGGTTADGTLLAADQQSPLHKSGEIIVTLAMSMITTADNSYQNQTAGNFTVTAIASQCPFEEDSFGSDYDKNAEYPTVLTGGKVTASVSPIDGKVPAGGVTLSGSGISATVPEGVLLENGVTELTLTVTPLESTTSDITVVNNEILIPVDVHIDGISKTNTVPIIIDLGEVLPKYLNMGNYHLFHIEDGVNKVMTLVENKSELNEHNQFTYNSDTGAVSVAMTSFSEVALVADTGNPWQGGTDTDWYNADATELYIYNADQLNGFSKIVGGLIEDIEQDDFTGKTVSLTNNINLNKLAEGTKSFYPIGYSGTDGKSSNSDVSSFSGTFDGTGHTIYDIYQNTWAMTGEYAGTYYNDAMGIFGYIVDGTVKNLTVNSFNSDGEFAPTGVITAYAKGDCSFENISIVNCTPSTYNTGVACIVGWDDGGDDESESEATNYTFKNITVDKSNTVQALWGTWDCAASGILGYLGKYSKADFINCNVAAELDVYNDVCANYQYYWYRYCGMFIGTVDRTDATGHALDMSGITAENCTVNFGDWNQYYYCEFVKNTIASYTHDYQFSRIPHLEIEFVDENGDGIVNVGERDSVTGCKHDHDSQGTEVINGKTVLIEDKQCVYLPFEQLFGGYGWGVDGTKIGEFDNIEITDLTNSQKKFITKFVNSENYLYRIGNNNSVAISSLFEAIGDINENGVYVSIDKVDEEISVSGTYTPNETDWEKGTIKFFGTGPVKITIQDYDFCEPTVLYAEIVDAENVTIATSATDKNIVLLNDISGGFTVANGYSAYGNGFKVICSGNGSYSSKALSYGYVTVNSGGILDNVQVICDIFPEAYLYTSEMSADSNGRYPYAYSAVAITGDSIISNSYIYGARNNIFIGSGNARIENTVTECGSLSNIQIKSSDAYTVTLKDVTTIQYKTTSTFDSSKSVLGFGVVVGDNESASNPTIKLLGDLKQYNWVTNSDSDVNNTYAKTAIDGALEVDAYQHTINDTTTVNMGIAYLNAQTAQITDERSNKEDIPYTLNNITISNQTGQVYSISNSNITAASRYDAEADSIIPYTPKNNRDIFPTVTFDDANTFVTFESENSGSSHKIIVDLDQVDGDSYIIDFSKLHIWKYGNELDFAVKKDGETVTSLTLNDMNTAEYSLEITDNKFFGAGGVSENKTVNYEYLLTVKATKTSIDPPKFNNDGTATAIRLVTSSGGDWRPAYTVLTGVSVDYWSVSESETKNVDISTLYDSGTISSNVWTYTCDDYTLTITGGAIHSDGSVITPVIAGDTLYFASTNKAFTTGTTSRSIVLTYVFTDKNASTTWNRTETVTYSELSEYDYNSFKNNGTLTEASSSGGTTCLAEGTLMTLADGTKCAIENLRKGDSVMAFDHQTGKVVSSDVIIVVKTHSEFYKNTFVFDDGTELVTINEHGIYDLDNNKYVNIDRVNADEYIGHTFVSVDSNGKLGAKQLIDVVSVYETGYKYDIVTDKTLNYVAEDTLSVTHVLVNVINSFEFDENMCYDQKKMLEDIEKYGLYTYDEWKEYCDVSVFEQYNIPVMKVGISKALYTKEYIISLIDTYVLDESVQIIG